MNGNTKVTRIIEICMAKASRCDNYNVSFYNNNKVKVCLYFVEKLVCLVLIFFSSYLCHSMWFNCVCTFNSLTLHYGCAYQVLNFSQAIFWSNC